MLGGCVRGLMSMRSKCTHQYHVGKPLVKNVFRTKGTEVYPSDLCKQLAKRHVEHFMCRHREHIETREPSGYKGVAGLTPTGRAAQHAQPAASIWPIASAGGLLAVVAGLVHT